MKKAITAITIILIIGLLGCLYFILKIKYEKEKEITISMVGDMLFDKSVKKVIQKKGADFVFGGYRKELKSSDIVYGNLETPMTTEGLADKDKQYVFRSDPEMAGVMVKNNFTAVSIANNHILDYGQEGLLDTIRNLKKANLGYAGSGVNIKAAQTPYIVTVKGKKIAFIAFTKVVPSVEWYAKENRPGVIGAYIWDEKERLNLVKKIKSECDILVVSIHWGKESILEVQDENIKLGHKFIDAGADIVMGHHPHIVQQSEVYKGKPIFYSLGNFVFTNSVSDERNKTMMAEVTFDKDGKIVEIRELHGKIKECVPGFKYEKILFEKKKLEWEIVKKISDFFK